MHPFALRIAPLALALLPVLTPAAWAEGSTPDVSDTLFATQGKLAVSVKGVGKEKQLRDFAFLYGVSDFEFDNGSGFGITGFLDEDFTPARLEPDEFEAEDWFTTLLEDVFAESELDATVDGVTFVSGKGSVVVKPGKGAINLAFGLVMSFELELTVDGEPVTTTGKVQIKAKGARAFFLAETSWDVEVKYKARLAKVGALAETDDLTLDFLIDNTFETFDPLGGPIEGTWVADENGVVTMQLDTGDIDFFLEDVISEVESEGFVFIDDLEATLTSAVLKVKVKAGVSLRYSLVVKFEVTGLLDGETPIASKGSYVVKGMGCFDA